LIETLETKEFLEEKLLIVGDVTPEKLVNVMKSQKGKMTIALDEASILDIWGGRYGDSVYLDPYLNGYSCVEIRLFRMNRTDVIEKPNLSMILAMQPKYLKRFVSNEKFIDNGLVGRFLFCNCRSNLGFRKSSLQKGIDQKTAKSYFDKFFEMLRRGNEFEKPKDLNLSPGAKEKYFEYYDKVEKRLRPGGEWEEFKEYGSKKVGAMLRIAGLFHCAEHTGPEGEDISRGEIERATEVIECLNIHAKSLFLESFTKRNVEEMEYLIKKMKEINKPEFSVRELFRKCQRKFEKVKMLEEKLEELEERNYIYTKKIKNLKNGKYVKTIVINPNI
jgi:hypothetical protein